MPSIDDVARMAGVSTATVSRALSRRGPVAEQTRQRVEEAVAALGYVASAPASSLASGRTRNIGVLVPMLDHWFFSAVLSGMTAVLLQHGYDLTLYTVSYDTQLRRTLFDTMLRRQRVDGVIVIQVNLDAPEVERLTALNLPVIAIGAADSHLPALCVDDHAVARLATAHLIALGHREIAHIGAGDEFDVDFRIPSRRREGYVQELAEAGIEARPDLYEAGDFTIDGGFRAARQLLGMPAHRPTAIFAASDEMAIGAVIAARELGYAVPGELSVIGVDGHDLGAFFELTTVDQYPRRQGERAAQAVLAALGEPVDAPEDALPYALVVRGTTARPAP